MKLHILHRTRFKYGASVRESFNEARLQPVTTDGQTCHRFLLKVLPTSKLSHYLDFYLNYVHLFEVTQAHTELTVEANSTVTTVDTPALAAAATPSPLEKIGECARLDRCYDFLQSSTYVDVGAELWRLADEVLAELNVEVDALLKSLRAGRFGPRPTLECGPCEYKSLCRISQRKLLDDAP